MIEELVKKWTERLCSGSKEDPIASVELKLRDSIYYTDEQLESDVIELGSILAEAVLSQVHPEVVYEGIGISWLVARGYTADRLDELKEDMPKILLYFKNVQTAKAIEAL